MKRLTIKVFFQLMLLTGLFGMISVSFAQQTEYVGGVGITVFRDRDYRGTAATYRYDMPNLADTGFNDEISSIRVGAGEQWEVCEHANYRGRCVVITGEESDLRRNDWDNMISSMRRIRGGGYPGPGQGPFPGQEPYIILHTDTNYRGTQMRYTDRTNNLFAMNNRAESVTVGRGEWELCEGIGFGGRCVTVSQSVPNLNSLGVRDKIRSVRPLGYDGPNPGVGYIVIYDQTNFRGTPTNYNSVEVSINKRARSITIGSGTWQICDGRNFTGRCETLRQSVANLGLLNINNTIRSVRPLGIVPPRPFPNSYIVIFEQENYRGNPTNYNNAQSNINKRAESITVGAGVWEVCSERNFGGRCETITQSMPNLRYTGLGNRIRSLRPLQRDPR